jgi:hypothetical protein
VSLLETEAKQGWLVGPVRWNISKHWIWIDGLVSAARVDDAGYNNHNYRHEGRRHRGECDVSRRYRWWRRGKTGACKRSQTAAMEGGGGGGSRRYGKRGAATGDACRSQRPYSVVLLVQEAV